MAFTDAAFGQGAGPIYLDNVQCSGLEDNLSSCPADSASSCGHSDDAGVECTSTCEIMQYISLHHGIACKANLCIIALTKVPRLLQNRARLGPGYLRLY